MGIIYRITNTVNDKVYIGKTSHTLGKRWKEHYRNKNKYNYPLYFAMRKYGFDKFMIEIIEYVDDNILNQREIYWIKMYDSFKTGYNCTLGGEGNMLINKQEVYNLWDDGLSIEQIVEKTNHDRSSIRKILKAYSGYSSEESNRRGDLIQGRKRKLRVYQYDLKGNLIKSYDSRTEASQETGISASNIWCALSGNTRKAGGFQWCYEGILPKNYDIKGVVPS